MSSKKSGRCREVAVVERFKQESVYGLSAKQSVRCRELAVSGCTTVLLLLLVGNLVHCRHPRQYVVVIVTTDGFADLAPPLVFAEGFSWVTVKTLAVASYSGLIRYH